MGGLLEGVRILDFGRYIAGPYCAALLADYGADVIRIEQIEGGEDRQIYPVSERGDGALFLQMNRNKRAIAIDVKSQAARPILDRLIKSANVVVANLPADVLKDLGLDYASLCRVKSDIILTSLSAYGSAKAFANRVGFDAVGQAVSGASFLSGFNRPTKSFASWVDVMTASMAAFATMAAIHEHSRSGKGQAVEGSLIGAALATMNFAMIEEVITGRDRRATGNRAQSGGPADYFPTMDGWIVVQVIGAPMFRRWARLVGRPEWIDDPRFASDQHRSDNGELLSEQGTIWSSGRTSADALDQLAAARISAGPVLSPRQLLQDPIWTDTGLHEEMVVDEGVSAPVVTKAVTMSRTPPVLRRGAPGLGEHNAEILVELGFDPGEIERMQASGVI